MRRLALGIGAASLAGALWAQTPASSTQPIYHVNVVSRTLEAVNYGRGGGPTPIDFRGTVLLPKVKGTASVDSHRGDVSIDAKLEHLVPPTRFGHQYLTYVLWAITPEGRPKNLGEVVANSSDKAHLKVTTDLQAFGLMITAEPYYSVTSPSNVVVAENVVRPDTAGTREEVTAKYELLPRGQYTMTVQPAQGRAAGGEKVSYGRYEGLLELYQAQNAVEIARSEGASKYARGTFDKAVDLLNQAQNMNARKMDTQNIVSTSREAAQMAEDARTIAVKRQREQRRAEEAQRIQQQTELRRTAEEQAAQAEAQADQAQAQANIEAQRAAAEKAQAQQAAQERIAAQQAAPQKETRAAATQPASAIGRAAAQRQYRAQLYAQLDNTLMTRDTPRGLVATISDSMFEPGNAVLRRGAAEPLVKLAQILAAHPDLRVRVEGYADTEPLSAERAQAVRSSLIAGGAPGNQISAEGYGNTRPIASETTAAGRQENRRVEVVIYGDRIGNSALWEHPYSLRSER